MHRAERTDTLVAALGEVLAEGLPDPFAIEVVAVPTRGIERWLAQHLSHRLGSSGVTDGVCAGVTFPSPARLLAETLAAVGGPAPDESAWAPDRLRWSVLTVLDEAVEKSDAEMAVVLRYLERAASSAVAGRTFSHRRLATATRLARLYDAYAAQRPGMLRGWLDGRDEDGTGQPLPDDLRWQAEVWRRVRDRVGHASPAEELPDLVTHLVEEPDLAPFPVRLSVFGPTRLTTADLTVLSALARHRTVHLWLPHPSRASWDRLTMQDDPTASPRLRSSHDGRDVATHPLLASLGRDSRELQVRVSGLLLAAEGRDTYHPSAARPGTLLGRLQTALAEDQEPSPVPLAPDDVSVQVHACHGLTRQVEVLRELIVGLLADDPTLEPGDVIVMCPDVEAAAPLAAAAFDRPDEVGRPLAHPGHRIRVRIADRSPARTNPLHAVLVRLLDLADARLTRDEVLGLAGEPGVARRFRLTAEELQRIESWLDQTGVRWGLDEEHRGRHALPGEGAGTWRAALERILLGAAMSEDGLPLVGGVLPLDDVPSNDIGLAGRLAEFVDRLDLVVASLQDPQPCSAWLGALDRALDLLVEARESEQGDRLATGRLLADLLQGNGEDAWLSLPDVRGLLEDALPARPTRASFRTGALTLCSMSPMRLVPHRVVVLLGLDDESFPRLGQVRGDDVLARRPCMGDREVRSEDRQILLDSVHAATERLVVLHTGMNPRTNAPEPPCVPVGELVDALLDLAAPAEDDAAIAETRARILVRHPLQPFDERNFETPSGPAAKLPNGSSPALVSGPTSRPFSFDPTHLALAEAARGTPIALDLPAQLRLPALVEEVVELDDLVLALTHPAKAFCRHRLGARPPHSDRSVGNRLPLTLDALDRWSVGDRVLRDLRHGYAERVPEAELARGGLPPGPLGLQALQPIVTQGQAIAQAVPPRQSSQRIEAHVGGRTVVGTLADVHGSTVITASPSKIGARHQLRAWVELLAATVADPSPQWTALVVGGGRSEGSVERRTLGPVTPGHATELLADLLTVRDLGMRQILPTSAETSHAYVNIARGDTRPGRARSATRAAQNTWSGRRGDAKDPVNCWAWGPDARFEDLLDCRPAEPVSSDHPTWFADLAHRIWWPLIQTQTGVGR